MMGCDRTVVYNHFEQTPASGWERNDTLSFVTTPITTNGDYDETVMLRINNDYPFMGITLVVEQTVYPTLLTVCDTLNCKLIDERGNAEGPGISEYQYAFPLRRLKLTEGNTVRISVRHDMKRGILPGVTDVGILLKYLQD
ncbi:MAG: gliding motility lipoprotein GldH [Prevotella sp.]|nr:gliding motility lipoprotein GldH [Prevotella sp.]